MTLAEIVQEARQLPQEEQITLVQMILDGLGMDEEISPPVIDAPDFLSLAGILNPEGKEFTDKDIEEIRWDYLKEKYL